MNTNAGATALAWRDQITLGTEQASTSGTEIDFTGIPAGVKRITINFVGVSTNGSSNRLIQIGDAGGPETSGYLGGGYINGTPANFTSGFGFNTTSAGDVMHGTITLTLVVAATFTWACSGNCSLSNTAQVALTSGSKSLSAELTQVRITTANGTDEYDAGTINITYE